MSAKKLLTVDEVAEMLNMSAQGIRNLAKQGHIPTVPIPGSNRFRFNPETIERMFFDSQVIEINSARKMRSLKIKEKIDVRRHLKKRRSLWD